METQRAVASELSRRAAKAARKAELAKAANHAYNVALAAKDSDIGKRALAAAKKAGKKAAKKARKAEITRAALKSAQKGAARAREAQLGPRFSAAAVNVQQAATDAIGDARNLAGDLAHSVASSYR